LVELKAKVELDMCGSMPKYTIYTDTTSANLYIRTKSKSALYASKNEITSKSKWGGGTWILVTWSKSQTLITHL